MNSSPWLFWRRHGEDKPATAVDNTHSTPTDSPETAIASSELEESKKKPQGAAIGDSSQEKSGRDEPKLDIEHVYVENDPRKWGRRKKNWVLFIIAFAAMASALAANIFFPAIDSLQTDLNASDQLITQSVALYILFQGCIPLLWAPISEIYGRKITYLASMTIFTGCALGAGFSKTMPVFIVMRILQGAGSSSVLSMGAATLADVFDTHERGTKVGFYYVAPLLGPSLGSLLGGAITEAGSWRTTFWFLTAYGGIVVLSFFFLPDTFRKERSTVWQASMKRAVKHAQAKSASQSRAQSRAHSANASRAASRRTSFEDRHPPTPNKEKPDLHEVTSASSNPPHPQSPPLDINAVNAACATGQLPSAVKAADGEEVKIKPTLRDVNPLAAAGSVLKQFNSLAATVFSGLLFAAQYSVSYTAARSFAEPPYSYSALYVGLVLLSFGVGNIIGSVCGGRYSDWVLARLKRQNGGVGVPEMRIRSVVIAMFIMPPSLIAFGWVTKFGTPIYWPVITLFINGVAATWIYSSIISYIIDSNPGSSSSAVACNSAFRGTFAMIASEVAQPLLRSIGNGWLYTGWALIIMVAEAVLLVIMYKRLKRAGVGKEVPEDDAATAV